MSTPTYYQLQAEYDYETVQRMKEYEARLRSFNKEDLCNEFSECLGCEPENYYSNANNYNNQEQWIITLLDNYSNFLYDHPEAVFIPLTTKQEIQRVNQHTEFIKKTIEEIKAL